MNKPQYLAELDKLLIFMTRADRERTLERYGALFDAAGPAGQDALLETLGTTTRQAIRLSRIYDDAGYEDDFLDQLEEETEPIPESEPAAEPEPVMADGEAPRIPEEHLPEYDMEDLPELSALPVSPQPPVAAAPAVPPEDEDDDLSLDEDLAPVDEDDDLSLDEDLAPVDKDDDLSLDEDLSPIDKDDDLSLDEDLSPVDKDDDLSLDDLTLDDKDHDGPDDGDDLSLDEDLAPAGKSDGLSLDDGEDDFTDDEEDTPAETAPSSEAEDDIGELDMGPAVGSPVPPAAEKAAAKPQGQPKPPALPAADRAGAAGEGQVEPEPEEDEEDEEDDGVPLLGPVILIERTMPLGVGVPLFILFMLLLAVPLAAVLLLLLPALILPGLAVLLGAWLAVVGGLWCISIIADAAMLFGLALILLAAGLVALWLGLWLFVLLVKGYSRAVQGFAHLTLGRKVTNDA